MDMELTRTDHRSGVATAYMFVTVSLGSLIPLVIAWAGGGDNPFIFNAGMTAGVVLGCLVFVVVRYRGLVMKRGNLRLIIRKALDLRIAWTIAANFNFAFFAWSTQFVDITVTAILFEMWPIFIILLTARLFRTEARFRTITHATLLLLFTGFAGFAFVMVGQGGGLESIETTDLAALTIGVSLAVIAAIVTAFTAFSFRWGTDLIQELQPSSSSAMSSDALEMFSLVIAYLIANSVSVILNSVIGISAGESITWRPLLIAIFFGGATNVVASLAWRKANLTTDNLGINAFAYTTPIFSLLWLFLFAQAQPERPDYLVIGAAAIIAVNLLVNFEAEVRFGFKALILSLWGCGAFVYLRDDFLQYLPFDGWLWPPETYLSALGLSATVFILLLTFRVARLAPRTQSEDNHIFALHRNLEMLARRNLIDPSVNEHIRGIDSAHNPEELQTAYSQAKLCFARAAVVDHPLADGKLLADAEAQLNMVVHSRQQGVDFGEMFSLIIFGGSTIALALLSRPAVDGWIAFLYEVFSVLFSSVTVFLIISVWDLHRERAELVLAGHRDSRQYGVIFRDPKSRRFEQGASVVVGLLIILAYGGMLWNKWLG